MLIFVYIEVVKLFNNIYIRQSFIIFSLFFMFTYVVNTKHYSKDINIYINIICDSHRSSYSHNFIENYNKIIDLFLNFMNESTGVACVALIWNVTKERFFLLQKNVFKKLTWFLLFIKSLFLFATILK